MNKFIFFILLIIPSALLSQTKYSFEFDYAQFRADSSSNLIEVYYKFNPAGFTKSLINSKEGISQQIIFRFSNKETGNLVSADTLLSAYTLDEIKSGESYKDVVGIYKTIVDEGDYDFSILIKDNFSQNKSLIEEVLKVKQYTFSKPLVSNLQLSSAISRATEDTRVFSKNTLKVVPNPTSSYTSDSPLLQYYSELYNVANRNIVLNTSIVSAKSKVVYSKSEEINSDNKSIVHVDQINLLRFPSGIYTLQLLLTDSLNNYAFTSQKQFYFYNKLYVVNDDSVESILATDYSSPFQFMSSEECDEVFEIAKYIASERETELYNSLNTIEGQREFLVQFWKRRSDAKKGNMLQVYNQYLELANEADSKFKVGRTKGISTDRGRIYLTYGRPSRTDRYPNESNLRPYETWYYDSLEGGVIFVFADMDGFSRYELIHSTKRGEIYDDTWQRRLYIER